MRRFSHYWVAMIIIQTYWDSNERNHTGKEYSGLEGYWL